MGKMLFWFRTDGAIFTTVLSSLKAYMWTTNHTFFLQPRLDQTKASLYSADLANESIKTAKEEYDCIIIGVVTDNEKKGVDEKKTLKK